MAHQQDVFVHHYWTDHYEWSSSILWIHLRSRALFFHNFCILETIKFTIFVVIHINTMLKIIFIGFVFSWFWSISEISKNKNSKIKWIHIILCIAPQLTLSQAMQETMTVVNCPIFTWIHFQFQLFAFHAFYWNLFFTVYGFVTAK